MTDSHSLQEKSLLACVEIGKAVTAKGWCKSWVKKA